MSNDVKNSTQSNVFFSAPASTSSAKPNFTDASSIGSAAQPNLASRAHDDFTKVQANKTNQNDINTYVKDLFSAAQSAGAGPSDQAALNTAATNALKGAGVSDDDIQKALDSVNG